MSVSRRIESAEIKYDPAQQTTTVFITSIRTLENPDRPGEFITQRVRAAYSRDKLELGEISEFDGLLGLAINPILNREDPII